MFPRWKVLFQINDGLVRFGYLWALDDMVVEKGLDPKVPILPDPAEDVDPILFVSMSFGLWLKGVVDGTDYLVLAWAQPRSGRRLQ